MSSLRIPADFLRQFEVGLNPRFPERSPIPARVLGYGEIGTTLEVSGWEGIACKRFPMFRSEEESAAYQTLHDTYIRTLREIGLDIVPSETERLEHQGRWIVYIFQEKLPSESIGHRAIHRLAAEETQRLIEAILRELSKANAFNKAHQGEREVAIDGQISNWAIVGFDPQAGLKPDIRLLYFDTSTPLMRLSGKEQLDAELFLRSAPSFMVWIIRWLFLPEVLRRYYDFRRVTLDLVANFYKEQRPDLVPMVVEKANETLEREGFQPLTVKEVSDYYREDARIWRVYLSFRKVDRALHHLFGRPYPYILPESIRR